MRNSQKITNEEQSHIVLPKKHEWNQDKSLSKVFNDSAFNHYYNKAKLPDSYESMEYYYPTYPRRVNDLPVNVINGEILLSVKVVETADRLYIQNQAPIKMILPQYVLVKREWVIRLHTFIQACSDIDGLIKLLTDVLNRHDFDSAIKYHDLALLRWMLLQIVKK